MSPAENRRARDAVRRTTRASTARPGHIKYVRTPLRGVPRSPRIEGHCVNLRAPSAAEFSAQVIRSEHNILRIDAWEELK
jgi:hypothetical protein